MKAMHKNQRTDPKEFRTMVERDVQWLFKLLPLCPKLRLLLTMGPIIGNNLRSMPLLGCLHEFAPRYGFKVIRNEEFWELWNEANRNVLVTHEADTPDEKCITCRVAKNLHEHRDEFSLVREASTQPLDDGELGETGAFRPSRQSEEDIRHAAAA